MKKKGVYNLSQIITSAGVADFYSFSENGENNLYRSLISYFKFKENYKKTKEKKVTMGDIARARPINANHTTIFESNDIRKEYNNLQGKISEVLKEYDIRVVNDNQKDFKYFGLQFGMPESYYKYYVDVNNDNNTEINIKTYTDFFEFFYCFRSLREIFEKTFTCYELTEYRRML